MKPCRTFSFAATAFCTAVFVATFSVANATAQTTSNTNQGSAQLEAATVVSVEDDQAISNVTAADRAFGAFQRGMFLTAFQLALPEAQAGNAAAQTLIAEIYERGLGIGQDKKAAAQWYKIAAASGNREAQFAYSVKLMAGDGTEQDLELGVEMMRKAADAGHPIAQFNYVNYLIDQRPTSATYRKALPYLESAAEQRLTEAYFLLAKIYFDGKLNGIRDAKTGMTWLRKAAEGGIEIAQLEMGLKLLTADATPDTLKEAQAWLTVAARKGNVVAQNRLAYLYFSQPDSETARLNGALWHLMASKGGRSDPNLEIQFKSLASEERQKAMELAEQLSKNNNSQFSRF